MSNIDKHQEETKLNKKKTRTSKILDEVTPGRKKKLLKLKDKIESGKFEYRNSLLDVFEEIMEDTKKDKY
ncbi:MAG: hypothetical protein K8S87_05375 [Planctomycetes bacterium]|nr:hypothetical protein [Planctomycetota bacterium]